MTFRYRVFPVGFSWAWEIVSDGNVVASGTGLGAKAEATARVENWMEMNETDVEPIDE